MKESAWDQNAVLYACSPAEAIIEDVCGTWLKELFGLPRSASFGFVTGCQMAHVKALAAARHKLLADRGWDVESRGLAAAPPIHVYAGELRHESILRAARLLGLGTDSVHQKPCKEDGRLDSRRRRRPRSAHRRGHRKDSGERCRLVRRIELEGTARDEGLCSQLAHERSRRYAYGGFYPGRASRLNGSASQSARAERARRGCADERPSE